MILTCPNCTARYLLASSALGVDGRDVRCAKCDHEWFAEAEIEETSVFDEQPSMEGNIDETDGFDNIDELDAEEDEDGNDLEAIARRLAEQQEAELTKQEEAERASEPEPEPEPIQDPIDEEDIPNAVKPIPEGFVPAIPEDVLRPEVSLQARMAGFGAAAGLFCIFVLAGFLFKNSIVSAWQPSAIIYEMAGMPAKFKGEGLIVESLSATTIKNSEGKETLVLKGRVINLTGDVIDVPKMVAILRSTNGEDGESWIIDPPVDQVAAGASFAFTSDYPDVPGGVGSVNLTFVQTLVGMKEEVVEAELAE